MSKEDNMPANPDPEIEALALKVAGEVANSLTQALVGAVGSRINVGPSPNYLAASASQLTGQFTCDNDFECWHFKCPKEINCSKAFDCVFTFAGLKLVIR